MPPEAVAESRRRYAAMGWRGRIAWPARTLSKGSLFQPSYVDTVTGADGTEFGIADCVVAEQGPNYLLAKRLQRWRATVAREGGHDRVGQRRPVHPDPLGREEPGVRRRLRRARDGSAWRCSSRPTANALMAALLVHDLRNPEASANPAVPLTNPQELFMRESVHGGMWRSPYAPHSVLGPAALLGAVEFGR